MQCKQCTTQFEITATDRAFYKKIGVPEPAECFDCRRQQLMAWRNERTLYNTACALCKKSIITMYDPTRGNAIYCQACYWSDNWDPFVSGRDFDFSRPFFEQFAQLMQEAPRIALINTKTENSEYCNRIYDGKNNYLSFIALREPENLYHTHFTMHCKDSVDISYCEETQKGYDDVDAGHSYNCLYSTRIENCIDSYFLEDCKGCSNCFGCKNLRQKSYCIFNKQYTKEEYFEKLKQFNVGSYSAREVIKKQVRDFFLQHPYKYNYIVDCENVSGVNLIRCKNSQHVFDLYDSQDCHYTTHAEKSNNCYDCYGMSGGAFNYYSVTVGMQGASNVLFSAGSIGCFNMSYCFECYSGAYDCFGCSGMKKNNYCILNKQYSKEEYTALRERIIEHMKKTGEWGQFFPKNIAPFAYNETMAQFYMPLTQVEATKRGFQWKAKDDKEYQKQIYTIPDTIDDVGCDIVTQILACVDCGKNYKVIKQELLLYKAQQVPIPRHCPTCRFSQRMMRRNPRELHHRQCLCALPGHELHKEGEVCHTTFDTPFKPERPEKVFCEQCYQKEVI